MARISKAKAYGLSSGISNEHRINEMLHKDDSNDAIFYVLTHQKNNLHCLKDEISRHRMAERYAIECPVYDGTAAQRLHEQIRKCRSAFDEGMTNISHLEMVKPSSGKPLHIKNIKPIEVKRFSLGIEPFDAMLGGGMPVGALALLGMPRKTGKTRLSTKIAKNIGNPRLGPDENGNEGVLYIQNEEMLGVFVGRYGKKWRKSDVIHLSDSFRLTEHMAAITELKPKLVIIDSIQEVAEAKTSAGMAHCLSSYKCIASERGISMLILSHLNGKGEVKGSTYLQHKVDIILKGEKGDTEGSFKVYCDGTRYGISGEDVYFFHTATDVVATSSDLMERRDDGDDEEVAVNKALGEVFAA